MDKFQKNALRRWSFFDNFLCAKKMQGTKRPFPQSLALGSRMSKAQSHLHAKPKGWQSQELI